MKDVFFGHIPPTAEEFTVLWKEALIILDTNVLLNQYRYSERTREQMFAVLDQFRERLWMPHQVGWEFFNNRRNALVQNERTAISGLNASLKALGDTVKNLKAREVELEALAGLVQQTQDLRDEQEAKRKQILREKGSDDPILRRIVDLYTGRTGEEPQEAWLDKHCELALGRMEKQIPPGYRDFNAKSKVDRRRKFGDYLLWVQILEYCQAKSRGFILVTNDAKDDWYIRDSGQTNGPRPELISEAKRDYKINGWLYGWTSFLKHAKAEMGADVSEETFDEVERILDTKQKVYHFSTGEIGEMFKGEPNNIDDINVSIIMAGFSEDFRDLPPSTQSIILQAHNTLSELSAIFVIEKILRGKGYTYVGPPGPGEEWSPP